MTLLLLGTLLFAGVHLVPSMAPSMKSLWLGKLGEGGYKGTFSLLLLLSFGLMIMGWRSAQPEFVYLPEPALRHPAMGLLLLAFFMLVISNRPSRVRSWVRHPQLTGVLLWSCAHLLINGDSRSMVLFGVIGLWCIAEKAAINKREGVWVKPDTPPLGTEIVSLLITLAVVAIVVALHPYISGMPVS